MCGICVVARTDSSFDAATLDGMNAVLAHRGPDAQNIKELKSNFFSSLGFGHCRLSIIDLDSRSEQPMVSMNGETWITLNGEIYNYLDLRKELLELGKQFRTQSDTEVILNGYEVWGEKILQRINGMFAFALWDAKSESLLVARDRLGKKPLYYTNDSTGFICASQLKAILVCPEFQAELDDISLGQYFAQGYISAPRTIFRNILKLLPGHYLKLQPQKSLQITRYWDPIIHYENTFRGGEQEAEEQLESLLLDSVKTRMISDVPLGGLLSGGIDSSLIVALMQEQSARPIKTFTIGFSDKRFDESQFAKPVAKYLGTEHNELFMTERDLLDFIPHLTEYFDEPLADASLIPTYAVSCLARSSVTVALSGDGGDELFLGYPTYQWMEKRELFRQILPFGLSQIAGDILHLIPQRQARKFGKYSQFRNPLDAHRWVGSYWEPKELKNLLSIDTAHYENGNEVFQKLSTLPLLQRLSAVDLTSYLVDDVLVKVDRASMSVALELRAPLLDYRVVELVTGMSMNLKRKSGISKYLLRKILYKKLPKALVDRPKMGFNVPIAAWLRGPVKEILRQYLDPVFIRKQGIFQETRITELAERHLSQKADYAKQLWSYLIFQMWYTRYA